MHHRKFLPRTRGREGIRGGGEIVGGTSDQFGQGLVARVGRKHARADVGVDLLPLPAKDIEVRFGFARTAALSRAQ